jgi:hypothetical protein
MASTPPADPFAFFREMVTQWESAANEWGTRISSTPEATQAMAAGTAMSIKAREAMHEGMAKALDAANMPSKADVAALGERLLAIESTLARIEAKFGGSALTAAAPPKVKRTRTPPTK